MSTSNVIALIAAIIAFAVTLWFVETSELEKSRDAECAALANIGRHRGETIVIYGDMPTWKLQCLFEGEE